MRRLGIAACTALLAAGLTTSVASPAAADTNPTAADELSYSNCYWDRGTSPIAWGTDTRSGRTFPANSTAPDNGQVQSHDARIVEAMSQWNFIAGEAQYKVSFRRDQTAANNQRNALLFSHVTLPQSDPNRILLGRAKLQRTADSTPSPNGLPCIYRGGGTEYQNSLVFVQIEMHRYDRWYTQTGTENRKAWEACPRSTWDSPSDFNTNYTCKKWYDFGAVALHEAGHGMGLFHPNDPGRENSKETRAAECGVFGEDATMCADTVIHRSQQRVLDNFDYNSYKFHMSPANGRR